MPGLRLRMHPRSHRLASKFKHHIGVGPGGFDHRHFATGILRVVSAQVSRLGPASEMSSGRIPITRSEGRSGALRSINCNAGTSSLRSMEIRVALCVFSVRAGMITLKARLSLAMRACPVQSARKEEDRTCGMAGKFWPIT